MRYKAKKDDSVTEYQGESFSKSYAKRTKAEWADNEGAHYVLTDDTTGNIVDEADLVRSDDRLSLGFRIGKTVTATLEGDYTLVVYQRDTADLEFNEKMKEYKITYKTKRG